MARSGFSLQRRLVNRAGVVQRELLEVAKHLAARDLEARHQAVDIIGLHAKFRECVRHAEGAEKLLEFVDGFHYGIFDCLLGRDVYAVCLGIHWLDAKDLTAKLQEALGVLAPHVAHPGGENHGEAGAVGDLHIKG